MKERAPTISAKKKTEEQKLVEKWEKILADEGLGKDIKPLEEELNNPDATAKTSAATYANAVRFDPKLAKEMAAGYGREGRHIVAAQAIAKRFNLPFDQAEELIRNELDDLNTDENASSTDLWRRFKSRT